jgi:hypothetical protein
MIPRQFYEKIAVDIEREGQSIIGVFGGDDGALPFAYTIGNAAFDLPELLLIGRINLNTAASLLNALGHQMRAARALPEQFDLGGQYPIRARIAGPAAKTDYTIQATRYFCHDRYDVAQVYGPDLAGIYPGESGCNPPYNVPLI